MRKRRSLTSAPVASLCPIAGDAKSRSCQRRYSKNLQNSRKLPLTTTQVGQEQYCKMTLETGYHKPSPYFVNSLLSSRTIMPPLSAPPTTWLSQVQLSCIRPFNISSHQISHDPARLQMQDFCELLVFVILH